MILNVSGGPDAFARVAANETARGAFAHNARGRANTTAFFRALRDALPRDRYTLSPAISPHPELRYGGRASTCPLADPNDPGRVGSVSTGMQRFTQTYGVSPAQVNVGTAFYGYRFSAYGSSWQSCNGQCGNAAAYINYAQVKPLVSRDGWIKYRDRSAGGAPYLLNAAPGFITYDDPISTTRKVAYVIGNQGFGGMFMWELSLDYDGRSQDLLSAMYAEYQPLGYAKPLARPR